MRTLLLFDGLGGTNDNLLRALRGLYSGPENAAFFQVVFDTIDEVVTHLDRSAVTEPSADGFAVRQWLDPGTATPDGVLGNSVAAGLCVYVYQTCHLQPARYGGDDVVASLGHSIGLLAAIVAGLRLRRMDEFLDIVASGLRLVAVSLARAQQVSGVPDIDPDLLGRYNARVRRGAGPGPMAALSGLPRDRLRDLVADFNAAGPALSVGLANSPSAHVLSGPTADLLGFYLRHETTFDRPGVTWTFLTNTVPFHSPHLAPAAHQVDDDRPFIGWLPGGDQLRLPVYATDRPRNLQESPDLVDEFLQQVLLRPIEWGLVTRHAVTDAAIGRIVDCGPGAAARRFTKECLSDGDRQVRFESVHQFFAPRALGGQHAMSALSGAGRTAQGNGSGAVQRVSGQHRPGG
ncbi:ACP S-malonyltransferase [Micromonospora sp. KC721]|uniref:ACP S-malonyltransferase n=1 Tax=Micromonospora sp. KC721 TaxID=2530380 RepID=UPI0010489220|nr:ACP S-malonyltransferase [Micromonospora sp. KC721]TDB82038.1 ACP S-malonyltransferase [Micromonospora sp. KC721]